MNWTSLFLSFTFGRFEL